MSFAIVSDGETLTSACDLDASIEAAKACATTLRLTVTVERDGVTIGHCGPDGLFEHRPGRAAKRRDN